MSHDDFEALAMRLGARGVGRSEATIQSDIRALFRTLPRGLGDEDFVTDLEVPVPGGGRIDLRIDDLVIEVKRSLTNPVAQQTAIEQVERYLTALDSAIDGAKVAVLTDGQLWLELRLDSTGRIAETGRIGATSWLDDPLVLVTWLLSVYDRAHVERVPATADNVLRLLGAGTIAHQRSRARLVDLFAECRSNPHVQLKRQLWAKLLTTALGTNFPDDDSLYIDHTVLVVIAELIAHAILGFDITRPDLDAVSLVDGTYFLESGVRGVVEADFFDWPVYADGGAGWFRSVARRVARIDWDSEVQHDVLKALYEGIISAEQRRSLGEYYTPDWLAEHIVLSVVDHPLEQRVHDPACGSGTFVFHAVHRFLDAASDAGMDAREAIETVVQHVSGIDIHPVAVTLARVTYLLAIGADNLRQHRPRSLAIPVHLGDSVQWQNDPTLLSSRDLVIETSDGLELLAGELRFPLVLVADVEVFDRTVAEMASRANDETRAHGNVPSTSRFVHDLELEPADRETLTSTFRRMCKLVDHGRDHIWGYYVRNLARPLRLSLREYRVDRLVGNPPWLTFNAMTQDMKSTFRAMCMERGIWSGNARNHDLAGLFVARSVELYLRDGGSFGFVMPAAVLNRQHATGLRTGSWSTITDSNDVKLGQPWDLTPVDPPIFPVPAAVMFGTRSDAAGSLPERKKLFTGTLETATCGWDDARSLLVSEIVENVVPGEPKSPYATQFQAGAKLDPRVLVLVERIEGGGVLGPRPGTSRVRSRRSTHSPWRDVPPIEANVENQFIRRALLGESIGPFRILEPCEAVVPWKDGRLLGGNDDAIGGFSGLESWQTAVESAWSRHRRNETQSWIERLDYQHRLSGQLRVDRGDLVVYPKSGSVLVAARVPAGSIIDQKLYSAPTVNQDEALYLCGVLNAPLTTERTTPFQSTGQFGARDFDKYPFQLPIPTYDPTVQTHIEIVHTARQAESVAAAVEFDTANWRRRRAAIREALGTAGMLERLDFHMRDLLDGASARVGPA